MPSRPVFSPDATLHNADWTRQTWDLPVHNVEDLRKYLLQNKIDVSLFKQTPVYTLNVEKLPWLKQL